MTPQIITRRRTQTGADRHSRLAVAIFLALLGSVLAIGAERAGEQDAWRLSGKMAAEVRGFADAPAYGSQGDGGQASWILNPEFDKRFRDGRQQFRLVPFLRLDNRDAQRTHFDIREAYWRERWDRWEMTAGINRVFWGVTESHHLVDVINQTDLVEDIDGEEKLGQPMVQLATDRSWGRLEAFALLGFRERTFPGARGRLRTPLPVDDDAAIYDTAAGGSRIDAALRWSHYFGDWDIGAYWFHGTSREPRLIPDPVGERLVPYYEVIHQLGVDVQYTRNAWLWKLEAIAREGQGATFGATVAGFEYTFYQIGRSAADVGLLVEYLYDGRDVYAPPTIYDDDLFVGSRLAFNDALDTQLLGGVIVDRNDGSLAALLEAERRVGSRIKLEFEARWFVNVDPNNTLHVFERDSHVMLRVSRFF
ncbi:MAG: hypothetical protein JSV80_06210 [Acidobacteriota bacterium]|nr:MAG: hypothetical protein JSV80_06210 [Acidobacteriota bacterium]